MTTIAANVASISPKLLQLETPNLVHGFGTQIVFPKSRRGLGHVTPTIFGIRSNISSKLLELVTSNLGLGWGLPNGRANNFP